MEEGQTDHGDVAQAEVERAFEARVRGEVADCDPEDVGAEERLDSDDQDTKSCPHFNAIAFGVPVSYHGSDA